MSATAAPRRAAGSLTARLSGPVGRVTGHPVALIGALTIALMIGSAFLRTTALDAGFWIDEALAVGVSSHGFFDIPSVLRLDGSPPLYYLLLHLWMQMFGTGEEATHTLSLVFALATIPAALWAGRGLWGPRAGWIGAALAALNPFLTYYAQETRMYALLGLLGIFVAATFLHAFVERDRRFRVPFGIAMAAMMYSHNYGLFLAVGTATAFLVLWRWLPAGEERRGLLRDGVVAYAVAGLLYLPWLPTLIAQARTTGAPWASVPSLEFLLSGVGLLFGGATPAIALLLAGGSGIATLVDRRADRKAVALAVMLVTGILLAWLVSQVSPAFATRYLAAFIGPFLVLAAAGLAAAGRLGLVCFAIVALMWLDPRTSQVETKSNARSLSQSIEQIVTGGDLVVSTQPEQLSLIAYYLPDVVRYADSLGPVEDPRVFDWRNAVDRLRAAKPTPTSDRLVRTLEPGQELVLVQPIIRTARWGAPWTSLVRKRSQQWERRLNADPRLRREAVVPVFGFDPLPRGIRAVVYRRVGPLASVSER
jgi:mannosyltransferase